MNDYVVKECRLSFFSKLRARGFQNKDILIEGGEIKQIGDDLPEKGNVIDCSGKIALPGLINCHTHSGGIFYRGYCDNKELDQWLKKTHDLPNEFRSEDDYNAYLIAI